MLAVTTLSFDIATLELLLPLTVGARVVIAGREEASDGAGLAVRLATSRATIMQATPATWRMLFQAEWQGDSGLKVLCVGDALPRDLADGLLATGAMVWNLYGPTETTIWSAIQRVEPGEGPVPIGRPIANTRMHILDANLQPVPVGVSGHIYIGGDGLARGYLGRPELTEERFISDPLGADSASRLYMTGDLGKYLADGSIQYLGRTDNQVKLRGFRIELGEIESVLGQNASVGEAAVCIREYSPEDHRLVAYVVPADRSAFSESELRDNLRRKLPDYMVPSDFVMLDSLPLTPNGKVDRKALPAIAPIRNEPATGLVEPRTPTERFIAEVWQELLGMGGIGVYDNFFDLGGHSLLSMQVIARLDKRFGVDLKPRELVFQTLGQLASSCDERAQGERQSEGPALVRRLMGAVRATVLGGRGNVR